MNRKPAYFSALFPANQLKLGSTLAKIGSHALDLDSFRRFTEFLINRYMQMNLQLGVKRLVTVQCRKIGAWDELKQLITGNGFC